MQRRSRHRRAPAAGTGALATWAGIACFAFAATAQAGEAGARVSPPDFVLKATDGRNLRLSEYRGEPVVLTFWSSGCGACRQALVALDQFAATSTTATIGVSIDADPAQAAAVASSLDLRMPVLTDRQQAVARAYDVPRLPYTLLLDRDGAVRATWSGVPARVDELAVHIASLRQE